MSVNCWRWLIGWFIVWQKLKKMSVGLLNYHCVIYVLQFHLVLMVTFGKKTIDKVGSSRFPSTQAPQKSTVPETPHESRIAH